MRKAWKEKWIVLRPENDHNFGYPEFFTAPRTINNQGFFQNFKFINIQFLVYLST